MAKGQRSNRQKALRTVRRKTLNATWLADAEAKRGEALAKCLAAAPVPVDNTRTEEIIARDDAIAAERAAQMAAAKERRQQKAQQKAQQQAQANGSMDVDGAGAGASRRRGGGKGGVQKRPMKRRVKQASTLHGANQFHKLSTKKGRKLAKKKAEGLGM